MITNTENSTPDVRLEPNWQFVGRTDARSLISTPALIVDIDVLDKNIASMALLVRQSNISLRPHAKCHKSLAIARRQIAEGAIGLCCASVGEAEVMLEGGITNLLITSPVVSETKIAKLCELARYTPELGVIVDNRDNIKTLSDAAQAANVTLNILIDVDIGMQRTGVKDAHTALVLARLIGGAPGLKFGGIQCYAGHLQHIPVFAEREQACIAMVAMIQEIKTLLSAESMAPQIISGGGTGTFDIDCALQIFTELQVGSYIFMDAQYNQVWEAEGLKPPFANALFVQATVISCNRDGVVTIDAGLKHFAVDGGVPIPAQGVVPGASYRYAGDEYGIVELPPCTDTLPLASRIEFLVPHCDPTVNLYNSIHCFSGETLVDIWPISARGR